MAYCWVNQLAVTQKATQEAFPLSGMQTGRGERLGRRRRWAVALFASFSAFPSKGSHIEASGQLLLPGHPVALLRTQMEIVLRFFWSGGQERVGGRGK